MELNTIEGVVRQRVRELRIDPRAQASELRNLVDEIVSQYEQEIFLSTGVPLADKRKLCAEITANIGGLGPLQQFLDDPEIEEIWANTPQKIFVSRCGVTELTSLILDDEGVRDLVERMLLTSGRRIDLSTPFVDAMLAGGERLHVVIPPITQKHWSFNIRKHVVQGRRLTDLAELGTLTQGLVRFLSAAVDSGLSVLVSGATQAGKTTFLRALAGAIPASQRVITCEEVFELGLRNRDVVALQTRSRTLEGGGEVELRDLVKETLRMRPERLIIGEVRGSESLDMIIALNSGVPGMCTIHANSAREALSKLCVLPLLAGENVTDQFVIPTVATTIDLVVHVNRDRKGRRYVQEVLYLPGRVDNGTIEGSVLYRNDGDGPVNTAGTVAPERFIAAGYDAHQLLQGVAS
ncbi:CpaF family protein [Boudabousia marimammalium]|uniref:Pilus assembly protein CpaF n=1 Tax=Boudabousia marimammalium TaxID=156892 RepID=A0A1Q5PM28_9ACTO|nr:ATPase, T2SS/T4P/T4SS family [Boudabousia marimammalium]OKL48096.1 pilus assembly protein CpaF [Boudabousia marimammalium]